MKRKLAKNTLFTAALSALLGLSAAQSALAAQNTVADGETLAPQDKVRLRVVEWRATQGGFVNSPALEGIYTIDDTGTISVPIAGRIKAAGTTLQMLGDAISTAFNGSPDMSGKPFVAVEIAEHAPIFITGQVETPGRFIYQPHMTVMQAVSMAGGFMRYRGDQASRDRIQAAGAYSTALISQRGLFMRRARLLAEIAGKSDFETPAELASAPDAARMKQDELALMHMRQVELKSRIDASEDLARLYQQEIENLDAKIKSQQRQIELSKQELDTVNMLISKGLTNGNRQLGLDRELAQTQSALIDLQIALTRSRQSLAEAQRTRADVINRQNAQNQADLNTVNMEIRRAGIEMQVAQLMGDQAALSSQEAMVVGGASNPQSNGHAFEITRRNDDGTLMKFTGDGATDLKPNDLVEVLPNKPDTADAASVTTPKELGALKPNTLAEKASLQLPAPVKPQLN